MHELVPRADMLQQTLTPTSSTPPASPAITLPQLSLPSDEKFLGYSPLIAGRAVIVELLARPNDDREKRIKLWENYQRDGGVLQDLGLAAQALERAGINWRQARKPDDVLEAFHALPQGTPN